MTKGSMKAIVAILGIVALFGLVHTQAADNNLLDALGGGGSSWASSITSTGPTATSVKIEFPVYTAGGEKIMNYAVSYVKGKSIASADLTDIKKVVFSNTSNSDKIAIADDKVTLTMDSLSANSTYNYVVTPINKEGTELDPSDEVSFTTTAGGDTVTATAGNGSGSSNETVLGAADTASANITYAVSGSKVTLKWAAIAGASKFMFSMKEANASTYKNIGEEMVSKETFSFVVGEKGLYSVKIVPVDTNGATAGAEKVLSIKIETLSPVDGKGTPATGPALNMILMSTFLLMLIYVVYRFRTTS